MIRYKNFKTGKIYCLVTLAINKTDANDDQIMVIYCPENEPNIVFVRDEEEFNKKFMLLDQ